ncbi:hypothetical protein TrRE_jg6111, partial [Triparma retinervis]
MTYGLSTASKYTGMECYVSSAFTKITCLSAPGTGLGHWAKVTVGGQDSDIYGAEIAYARPSVNFFSNYSWEFNPAAEGAQTPGNESIVLHGSNFGTIAENAIDKVSYGPNGVEYRPCEGADHADCACQIITSPGLGSDLKWQVTVDGQMNISDVTTNYKQPEIYSVAEAAGETKGGTSHVISGKNLGVLVSNSYVEVLFDGKAIVLDGEYNTTAPVKRAVQDTSTGYIAGRSKGKDTDYINFILPPMAEVPQAKTLKVRVGHTVFAVSQDSNEKSFVYGNPKIDSIENLAGEKICVGKDETDESSCQSTTELVIRGKNFGGMGLMKGDTSRLDIDGTKQMLAGSKNEVGISEWTDDTITLLYLGAQGNATVTVGEEESNMYSFKKRSPLLLMDPENYPQYLPNPDGYRTTGVTHAGEFNLTLAGCFLPKDESALVENEDGTSALQVTIHRCMTEEDGDVSCDEENGAKCKLYPSSLKEVSTDLAPEFCKGDTVRELKCKLPEGTGEVNEVILKYGSPNFRGNGTIFVHYLPPVVAKFDPKLVLTTGDEVTVTGDNFGTDADKISVSMGGTFLEIKNTTVTHTSFVAVVPPGEGTAKNVYVTVDGQTNVTHRDDPGVLRYLYPIIDSVDPTELDTIGGNVSVTGSLEFVVPEGQNTRDDPMELLLHVAGQVSDPITINYGPPQVVNVSMCFSEAFSNVFKGPCELNEDDMIVPLGDDCDPYDGANGGCRLNTNGGYTLVLFGENFGKPDAGVQKVSFGGRTLKNSNEDDGQEALAEVHFVSHTEIRVRIPAGVGVDIPIKVKVGERESIAKMFSYDPPYIEEITPNNP